ncbi:hypothetical protein ACFSO7_20575 [Bacillus sp. CGMCC 1.16607]|uniref:hypothetical protein n=1 Tax=Bacillus sp. CGMCC 1.16607 TaxID=3351842 RepID=UPI003635AEF8
MLKKLVLSCFLLIISVGLLACSKTDEKTISLEKEEKSEVVNKEVSKNESLDDKLKREIEDYQNQITPILSGELPTLIVEYDNLRKQSINDEIDNYTFAEIIYSELLPANHQIKEDLDAIMPSTELREAHEILKSMVAKNARAFTELITALNDGDASKINSANKLVTDARKLEGDYMNAVAKLGYSY